MALENPAAEYAQRRNGWEAKKQNDDRLFRQIGNTRLAVAAAAALVAYAVFGSRTLPAATLLIPLLGFICLVVWHSRVSKRQTRAARAISYYTHATARLEHKWPANEQTGGEFCDPEHIYTGDLDVFRRGSLFQMLASTRTRAGEQRLAHWLCSPATLPEAVERQSAVKELRGRLDLREDLALLGSEIQSEAQMESLSAWAEQPPVSIPRFARPLVAVLGTFGAFCIAGFFAHLVPFAALALAVAVNIVISVWLRRRVVHVLVEAGNIGRGLNILALALARLSNEKFDAPHLQALCARLGGPAQTAAARILSLQRWMDWKDSSDHILVRALQPVLLGREQIALGIEHWRGNWGPKLPGWLDTVAELEALSSLAALSFENPTWSFPELDPGSTALFDVHDLRHPLLSLSEAVPNSLQLDPTMRLFIVSGSNMSGKSTLLRSIGLAVVLAWAGSAVPAQRLRLSRVQIAASIRIEDSLLEHRSRFYAEILKLRKLAELTDGALPVLFLLDEILSGTNSHDRRIGAEGVIRKLLSKQAVGLVTTHDLALAQMEEELRPLATNVHFDDRLVDGHLEFDYRLKPGIVTRSNALELMRAVGIDVLPKEIRSQG